MMTSAGDVSVEIRGSEKQLNHGHQLNLGDRDPTQMNDHVRVRTTHYNGYFI